MKILAAFFRLFLLALLFLPLGACRDNDDTPDAPSGQYRSSWRINDEGLLEVDLYCARYDGRAFKYDYTVYPRTGQPFKSAQSLRIRADHHFDGAWEMDWLSAFPPQEVFLASLNPDVIITHFYPTPDPKHAYTPAFSTEEVSLPDGSSRFVLLTRGEFLVTGVLRREEGSVRLGVRLVADPAGFSNIRFE